MAPSSSMWLLAVLANSGCDFAASVGVPSEVSPVRRQRNLGTDRREIDCIFWGDARPAGHPAGTTKMSARLFRSTEEAEEHFDHSVKMGADIVMYYKGCPCTPSDPLSHPVEFKHNLSTHFKHFEEWHIQNDRTLHQWCKETSLKYEDVSPDKWRPSSFIIRPPRKDTPMKMSSALKQQLATKDEDEGPATAYSGDWDLRCVITGNARQDHTNLNATLFTSFEDASLNYKDSVSLGTDLVIQYNGKRELKRHVAPKLKHVPWLTLLNWCKDVHKEWKKQPRGVAITEEMIKIGRPSKLVAESFIRVSKPPKVVPQEIDQGSSMMESAESENAFVSKDFAQKKSYSEMQELLNHGMRREVVLYKRFPGWDCGIENFTDTRLAGADMTVAACKELCDKDLACGCLQYDRSNGVCHYTRNSHCHESRCKKSQTTSIYLQSARWATDTTKVKKFAGKACADSGLGGKVLGVENKVKGDDTCQRVCASEPECSCYEFNRYDHSCTTMKECDLDRCEASTDNDMYVFEATYNGYDGHSGQQW